MIVPKRLVSICARKSDIGISSMDERLPYPALLITTSSEPALVFLHYWGGTSRTWRKVTAELEKQFKTVAYDARGWGKSDKTLAGYKLADLADEALSLVKALGITQYVLVGHSMGGKVAQLIASRRPEGLQDSF
jgi:pimeloyl-ACP methyl ester carboxylesterase